MMTLKEAVMSINKYQPASLVESVFGSSSQSRRLFEEFGTDNSQPNDVTTSGDGPPRPRSLLHFTSHLNHLFISLLFHPGGDQDRCGATYFPTRSNSLPTHWVHSLKSQTPPLSLFLPPHTARNNANFGTL